MTSIFPFARFSRRITTAMLLMWLLGLVAACSPDSNIEIAASVLNRGLSGEPESLDPHKISSNQSESVLRDMGEGLISYGADGSLKPGVARSWEVAEDGLTITFHLRPEARWSNGNTVTASDFVFAFRRLTDPQTAAPYAEFLSGIENSSDIVKGILPVEKLGVDAIDNHTLQIRLRVRTPHFLQLLAHPSTFPIDQESFRKFGTELFKPGAYVSNGAYVLVDWSIGSAISLRRNNAYWARQSTSIEQVVYHIVNQNDEFNRYRAGEIDITANVPESVFSNVRKERPSELRVSPYLGIYYYGFNLKNGLFSKNQKLRQALSMAIDRQALVGQITARGEISAYSWVPPGVHLYGQQQYDFADLDKTEREEHARRLYAEAGYKVGDKLKFELRYNTFDGNRRIALAIQSMWRDVLGVNVKLVNEEFKVFIDNIRNSKQIEAFRLSWTGDYNDAFSFLQLMMSGSPSNLTGYSNPDFDQVVSSAEIESDPIARKALLEKAERIAMADYPVVPLYFYVSKHLVSPSVVGWENNVMDIHLSRHLSLLESVD